MIFLVRGVAVFVLFASGLVAGCSPTIDHRGYLQAGRDFELIRPGLTKDDVEALLGSPSTRATIETKNDGFYYISSKVEHNAFFRPKVLEREIIAIRFDRDGRVGNILRYDLKDGKVIDFVSRTTEAKGKELTIMEQMLENIGRIDSGSPF